MWRKCNILPSDIVDAPFTGILEIQLDETEQPDLVGDVPVHCREAGLNASPSDSVILVYILSLICLEYFL